jgi:hypothetical protein
MLEKERENKKKLSKEAQNRKCVNNYGNGKLRK